jgi:hypothetical protein
MLVVVLVAAPVCAVADNSGSPQSSANLESLLEEQSYLLQTFGLAPIIVSRGERVGDTFNIDTMRLIAGADDCFPGLTPRKVPAQLPTVTVEKAQGLAAALGVASVVDVEGNIDAVQKYELAFSHVVAITASTVQLRAALKSGEPECEALRPWLVAAKGLTAIELPDNTPRMTRSVVIGTLFMAKRTIRITVSSKAVAKASLGERILSMLGISSSFKARASGNKGQQNTIELIGDDVIPVAFSSAFRQTTVDQLTAESWVAVPTRVYAEDIHSQSFTRRARDAFEYLLHD